MTDNLDILAIGESLIEFSACESLTFANNFCKCYGGDVLNTAIVAARLGARVGYITKVGNDYFKDYLLDSWLSENLDISNVKIVDNYNGLYIVSREPDGKKEIMYYRKKSAASTLSVDDIPEDVIERASIVYTTGITQSLSASARCAVKKAFSIAGEKECMVAYDPNYRSRIWDVEEAREALEEVIEYIDIIMLSNVHDAEKLIDINSPDKIIKYFWDRGVQMVAVKMGELGCAIGYKGEIITIPHRDVEVVDSTGAGDTFNGGFLYGVAKGYTPFEAGKLAVIAASEQAKGLGAIRSVPCRERVFEEFNEI
ncbi:MAG: sugar kinase [Candidatus Gastranaerophilales bacterium]|nr:sugar kinase [Candidatus Gastranaerophilales bacterium]